MKAALRELTLLATRGRVTYTFSSEGPLSILLRML